VIKISFSKLLALLGAASLAVLLSACGGSAPGAQSTTGPVTPTAAKLDITLSKNSIKDIDSDSTTVTVRALNSSNQTVAGVSIAIAVDSGVFVAGSTGSVTDSKGEVTGTLSVGSNKSNRIITLTASSASLKQTAGITVTGANLSATVLSTQPVLSGGQVQIKFSLKDANSQALPGVVLTASSSLVSFPAVTGTTDVNGEYLLSYTVGNLSGQQTDTITASAGGSSPLSPPTVKLGSGPAPIPSGTPSKISLQANPAVVAVNAVAGSTTNRAELRALVLTATDTVVKDASVKFRVVRGSNFGGLGLVDVTTDTTIGTVLTDAYGTATNSFVPGAFGSSKDGVLVCASVVSTQVGVTYSVAPANPDPGCASNESGVLLTVAQQALSVTIGHDNTIENGQGGLTYIKKYTVLVTDVAGNPVSGADVSWLVDPLNFIKGSMIYCGVWGYSGVNAGCPSSTNPVRVATCPNEDINRNGNLDAGEDINGNGKLDPRIPITLSSLVTQTTKTDSSGFLILKLEYPENYAYWNYVQLTVSTRVGQSEGRASYVTVLDGMSSDYTDQNNAPAGAISPYGSVVVVNGIVVDNTASCQNPN
jgi:hypothetical protein